MENLESLFEEYLSKNYTYNKEGGYYNIPIPILDLFGTKEKLDAYVEQVGANNTEEFEESVYNSINNGLGWFTIFNTYEDLLDDFVGSYELDITREEAQDLLETFLTENRINIEVEFELEESVKKNIKKVIKEDIENIDLNKVLDDFVDSLGGIEKDGDNYKVIYDDIDDALDNKDVYNIFEKGKIKSKNDFVDYLSDEIEMDIYDYEMDYLIQELRDYIKQKDLEEYEEDLKDLLSEKVYVDINYDYYLDTEYKSNIIVDTGDSNYDFSLNPCAKYPLIDTSDEDVMKNASIVWLIKQQGYTVDEYNKVAEGGDTNSKFLKSLVKEVENCYDSSALVFLVKASLNDILRVMDDEDTSITIGTNCVCGLFDIINGGGSILDIELEKPVTIPHKYIGEFFVDYKPLNYWGYGVDDVYGLTSNAYSTDYTINGKAEESVKMDNKKTSIKESIIKERKANRPKVEKKVIAVKEGINGPEIFINYYNAKQRAEDKGLKLAEYGDYYGNKFSYAFWNKDGDRNQDEEVIAYYFFDDEGKPKTYIDESDVEIIKKQVGLRDNDILDIDEIMTYDDDYEDEEFDESCKKEAQAIREARKEIIEKLKNKYKKSAK